MGKKEKKSGSNFANECVIQILLEFGDWYLYTYLLDSLDLI